MSQEDYNGFMEPGDEKPVYTVEKHVGKLVAIMSRDKPCNCCPAGKNLASNSDPTTLWDVNADHPCRICREFVGLTWDADGLGRWGGILSGCPCNALGDEEAIRRTFDALRDYRREMIP